MERSLLLPRALVRAFGFGWHWHFRLYWHGMAVLCVSKGARINVNVCDKARMYVRGARMDFKEIRMYDNP